MATRIPISFRLVSSGVLKTGRMITRLVSYILLEKAPFAMPALELGVISRAKETYFEKCRILAPEIAPEFLTYLDRFDFISY